MAAVISSSIRDVFSSDTHFGALRTLKLSLRPFETVAQMDRAMVARFIAKTPEDGRLIHLGDWGEYEAVKQFKFPVILVCGNYELNDVNKLFGGNFSRFRAHLLELGFAEVYEKDLIVDDMYCNHFPANCDRQRFNLFGHIHKSQMVKRYGLNVGVDCHDFAPVTNERLAFYRNAIENHYDDQVFD